MRYVSGRHADLYATGRKGSRLPPDGRNVSRLGAIIAHFYVEHYRENNLRAKRQDRESGLFNGWPGYGWRLVSKGVIESVPAEAAYVIKCYEDFLAGKELGDIADDMTAAGQLTRAGNKYRAATIRGMLRQPVHAGLIEYIPRGERLKGRVDYSPIQGEIFTGNWEPIISRETWERAVTRLSDHSYSSPVDLKYRPAKRNHGVW